MTNLRLPSTALYEDVMTHNAVAVASRFLPKKQVLRMVQEGCRDSARTPMQWNDGPNAGFSTGKPWFFVNDNYPRINVAAQEEDPQSLLNFYRRLLRFRKDHPVVLYGTYRELLPKDKKLYVYLREHEGEKLLVICSFSEDLVRFDPPEGLRLKDGELVLSNYDSNFIIAGGFTTRPYELRVYLFPAPGREEA